MFYFFVCLEFKGKAEVFLDVNESLYEIGYNCYLDFLQWKFKQAISILKGIVLEYIFLGNGSDEVIDLLFWIFCEFGADYIIILFFIYGMYWVFVDIFNVLVKEIFLCLGSFQLDVEVVLVEVDVYFKLLFICSFNNLIGNSICFGLIWEFIKGFLGIVVVDEVYIDFFVQESVIYFLLEYFNFVVL